MATEVKNKSAVITGGATGIGLHIADQLLLKGARLVVILDLNEEKGNEASDTLNSKHGDDRAEFIKCDVTKDLDDVSKRIFEKHGSIDILVNNAGILKETSVRKTMEVNAIAGMEWAFKFFDTMRTDRGGGGGTILNISSVAGFRRVPFYPCYAASKHAIVGFTTALGHPFNLNKFGVRVLVLCPGMTETNIDETMRNEPSSMNYEECIAFQDKVYRQKPEHVGKVAVEVIEAADSGTVWAVQNDQPVEEVKQYAE